MISKEKIIKNSDNWLNNISNNIIETPGFEKRHIYQLLSKNKSCVIIGLRRIGKTLLLKNALYKFWDIKIKNNLLPNYNMEDKKPKLIEIDKGSTKQEKHINFNNDSLVSNSIGVEKEQKKVMYLKLDSIEFVSLDQEEKNKLEILIKEIVIENGVELLLLDEIQILNNWNYLIKDLVEYCGKNLKIIATGSDSSKLVELSEMGVGRFKTMFYTVPSFVENKNIFADLTLSKYIDFLHFPHYKNQEEYDEDIKQAVVENAFNSSKATKTILYRVLRSISNNVGKQLNKNRISSLSGVNKTHLESYLSDLVKNQLLFELKNTKINQNSKFYPLIPGSYRLFNSICFEDLDNKKQGDIFEQFIFIQILSHKHSLHERLGLSFISEKVPKNKINEIDLVYEQKGYEIKYSHNIDKISDYIDLAVKNNLKEIHFIYLGETRELSANMEVKFWNWKDFDYAI